MDYQILEAETPKIRPDYFGLDVLFSLPLRRGMSNARLHGKGALEGGWNRSKPAMLSQFLA
jgi:hypothetical protein